ACWFAPCPAPGTKMMKILVTGGCGFIGRHLTHELVEHGHSVRILDALIEQVHGSLPPDPPPGAELVRGDLRDARIVASALAGIDAVVHLAAEVGVGQSMYEIARYVGANDLGTAVLLEAMIGKPIRRVVVASSRSEERRVGNEGRRRCSPGAGES